jgi:transketolase
MKWQIGELVETRDAFGEALLELGRRRPDVVVMDSDLQRSNKTYAFGQENPDRFFDLGIAEADMICTAAGMAATGMTVFAASFAMFVPGRCYDQIRLQLSYGRANVKAVGVSAGLTQGPDGATHQALDDVALTRQLPGMTVLVPADATEAYLCTLAAAETLEPVYLRLGRYPTPVLFGEEYVFQIGAVPVLRSGKDLVLFGSGIMTAMALATAGLLHDQGLEAAVLNVSTVKPLHSQAIVAAARGMPRLLRIGVQDEFGQSGTADELLAHYGLTPPQMATRIVEAMRR